MLQRLLFAVLILFPFLCIFVAAADVDDVSDIIRKNNINMLYIYDIQC